VPDTKRFHLNQSAGPPLITQILSFTVVATTDPRLDGIGAKAFQLSFAGQYVVIEQQTSYLIFTFH
jgi:hypothetical protein